MGADVRTRNFIDGDFVSGEGRATFPNVNPVDGSLNALVEAATKDDVDRAVAAAKRAMKGPWGRSSMAERGDILHRVADRVMERFDEFLAAEVADTGKPHSLARVIDIPRGAANFKAFADVIRAHGDDAYHTHRGSTHALNYTVRAPRGVIAVICPWNLPLLLMTWKVAPALAAGNAVVVKPSEETPSTTALLAEVMREVGVPDGVFNVVNGYGPDAPGQWLCDHPDVDAITFTGESATGESIMRSAASRLRDVSFELGGKNAALVFADCDLDAAIEGTTRSVFANCGQICLQTERVYVHRSIFDAFTERLAANAAALVRGRPEVEGVNMGPLVSAGHREKVLSYYAKAVAEGAEVRAGGGVPEMGDALNGGFWIEPTIWTGLPETASVVTDEIFGPCCHIRPFDDEDEVVALANDTDYGLAASVWTRDVSRAHRVAAQMDVGICWVNSWYLRDLRTPFGGAKRSGIGREGGHYSLEFYTELRNICVAL